MKKYSIILLAFACITSGLSPKVQAQQKIDPSYFPFKPGLTWHYSTTKNRSYTMPDGEKKETLSATSVEKFSKNDLVPDDPRYAKALMFEQKITEKSQTTQKERTVTLQSLFEFEDGVVSILGQKMRGAPEAGMLEEFQPYEPAAVLLDIAKVNAGTPFSMELSTGPMKMSTTAEKYEFVTLTTKLGELTNVLKITNIGTVKGSLKAGGQSIPISDGKIEETIWLAPGKGLAKQDHKISFTMSLPNGASIKSVEHKIKEVTKIKAE